MNVYECITKQGLKIEVDKIRKYQTVDISFINSDGKEDETEFDVTGINTKSGIEELSILFDDFCRENGFQTNTVTSVIVVKSANSFSELGAE